jgi:hypothetical protein
LLDQPFDDAVAQRGARAQQGTIQRVLLARALRPAVALALALDGELQQLRGEGVIAEQAENDRPGAAS